MDQNWYQDVKAFHEKFGCYIGKKPGFPPPEVEQLRIDLILEEFKEVVDAMKAKDIEGVADGITDLIYVLVGMAVSYGIPLDKVWAEVQKSNMLKEGGATREDGKILKPAGWVAPDIEGALYNCRDCKDEGCVEVVTRRTGAEHHPSCNGYHCSSQCPVPVEIVEVEQGPCYCRMTP
jgi:predicted HAD superfamily Cof-like phosphohydrolase